MFRTIISLLAPPSKPDEERDRIARWLHFILIGVMAGSSLITLSAYFTRSENVSRLSVPFLISTILAYTLNKAGRTNTAIFVFLILLVGTITYATLTGNGIHDIIVILYPVILVIGGLILGPRIYWLLAVITVASVGAVVHAETQGWIISPFSELTDFTDFVMVSSILVVQAFIVSLLIANLMKSLKNARLENMERIRAEKEREDVIRELEARNDELLRFTYTVSHELKSPIVTIKGFLGSVQKDMARDEYDKARRDLKRIDTATDKMHQTINDLLELSRISRVTKAQEKVDVTEMVREVVNMAGELLRINKVAVQILPGMPDVVGDRTRLREVFENLISNAVKYRGEQSAPTLEIGSQDHDGEIVFYVKDNGMGIEPQYHTRIFDLFEKLNPTAEGTGVGLALVKRIIETHGGKIWVESEGWGKGSTFCFTLPTGKITG